MPRERPCAAMPDERGDGVRVLVDEGPQLVDDDDETGERPAAGPARGAQVVEVGGAVPGEQALAPAQLGASVSRAPAARGARRGR